MLGKETNRVPRLVDAMPETVTDRQEVVYDAMFAMVSMLQSLYPHMDSDNNLVVESSTRKDDSSSHHNHQVDATVDSEMTARLAVESAHNGGEFALAA